MTMMVWLDDDFDRRTFVGGAIGAALGLLAARQGAGRGTVSALLEGRFSSKSASTPFNILVLGDSYAWQPGLLLAEKSCSLVRDRIAAMLGGSRPVTLRIFARSGAVIGELDYTPDFLAKDNAAPWPGEVPDAFWDDPHPGGDFSYAPPSIWRQMQRAKDPNGRGYVDPKLVDLVLLSGGGNDVAVTNIVAPRAGADHHAEFRQWIDTLCGDRMKRLLPAVASSFPNAKIVVTGYPQVITDETDSWELAKYLGALGITAAGVVAGTGAILPAIELIALATPIIKEASEQQSETFADESSKVLREAVDQVNAAAGTTRAAFADVRFTWGPGNAYGASSSFFWSFTAPARPPDHTADARNEICKTHNHVGDVPLDIQCVHGAMGHPNVEGARAYADAVTLAMLSFAPGWLASSAGSSAPPPPLMKLDVRELSAGATSNTIVVDAMDARTGAPIRDATVELYGVTARASTPLTYAYPPVAPCLVPNGSSALGARIGARIPMPAIGICVGRVSRQGYPEAFFAPPPLPTPKLEVAVQVVGTTATSKTVVVRASDGRTKKPVTDALVYVRGVGGRVDAPITYPSSPPPECASWPGARQAGAPVGAPGMPQLTVDEIRRMCTDGTVSRAGYQTATFKP